MASTKYRHLTRRVSTGQRWQTWVKTVQARDCCEMFTTKIHTFPATLADGRSAQKEIHTARLPHRSNYEVLLRARVPCSSEVGQPPSSLVVVADFGFMNTIRDTFAGALDCAHTRSKFKNSDQVIIRCRQQLAASSWRKNGRCRRSTVREGAYCITRLVQLPSVPQLHCSVIGCLYKRDLKLCL